MEISQDISAGRTKTRVIAPITNRVRAASRALVKPTDVSSLATFRVLFGALMVYEVYRYHVNNRIPYYYLEPNFYFTYELFPFVVPPPGQWMYVLFFVMALSALGIALGFFYRISAILFFLTYTYVFLIDKAQYNNHYYLIILLAFLLMIVDAHRWASIDQKLRPGLHSEYVPYWQRFIFLAQMVIVYFYAGVAKINVDWLAGRPVGDWLEDRSDYPVVGPFFTTEWATYFFAYGGLLFDLAIGFLLLWPRTRLLGFLALLFFHLTNKWLFSIGIFPYLMIAATILFVSPDWPRRVLHSAKFKVPKVAPPQISDRRYWILGFVTVYVALQILIPLRHWLYPSYVAWSEEGHRFSWRMKLRSKSSRVAFYVTNPHTNRIWEVDLRQDLTSRQVRKMSTRPDMIIQYVHHLKQKLHQVGIEDPIIQVSSQVSLNGRSYQPIIDPTVNLAEAPLQIIAPSTWLLPLEADHPPLSDTADQTQ
jgi:uncharacterized membrane protein YphA (DoxX/SURF4 family)